MMPLQNSCPTKPARPDAGWKARAAALRQEKPANVALVFAVFAILASFVAWIAVLVPSGGNVRGSPVFWLLAVPLMCWTTPLIGFKAWAVNTVGLALLGAPLLSLAALFAAPHLTSSPLPSDGPATLATPGAMVIVLGITLLLSTVGAVALRQSSLPGGTRPPSYAEPGALPGVHPVPPGMTGMLAVGSLAVSGPLVNGMFFSIVALLDLDGDIKPPWPAGIPILLVGATLALNVRGSRHLVRGTAGAGRSLRQGWWTGAASAGFLLLLLWVWPTETALKLAFSVFMVPMTIAALWGARNASRSLREIEASR